MQPGDGLVEYAIAERLASGGRLVVEAAAHQLAVAGVGRQALAAVFEKGQAPLPLGICELAEAPAPAHRREGLLGHETRAAGQGYEVLQKHIQRQLGRPAVLHQPGSQPPPHGAQFQQLEGIGGHEQHLGGAPRCVGTASCALQQAGQVLGGADLHHPLHGLKIHTQIQGAGAHHPAQVTGFHPGLDRLALSPIDGAVVQGEEPLHLGAGEPQALVPALGLVAGVGEQQGAHRRIQAGHQLFVHAQSEMAAPGEAIDRVGQQAADRRGALDVGGDDAWFWAGRRRSTHAHCCLRRLVEIADRGADRPGAQARPQLSQPAQAELGLHAALAAHQLVPLVDDHGLQRAEQLWCLGIGKQQAQGFRRCDQDLGGRLELFAALMAAGVAIADGHPQRPAHGADGFLNRQGEIAAQGPQGGEHQQLQAVRRLGSALLASLSRQHLGDGAHHRGIGFPRPRGHLQQAALPREIGLPALVLERHRGPALQAKPGLDRLQHAQGCCSIRARAEARLSASVAGLSRRQRLMRGKRTAIPLL